MLFAFSTVFFVLQLQILLANAASPQDATLVGCFTTNFVKSNDYYKVRQALPWEHGVMVCIERLTVYVGVQTEPGSSDDNFFYCGNELLEHSEKVDSTQCQPCQDNTDRQCGGVDTMSLYKLRDLTPLQLLLATGSSGVRMWTDDNSPTPVKIPYTNSVTDVDYLYANDDIYFSYSSYMYRSFYKYTSSKFSTPGIIFTNSYTITSLAVDWTSKKVYGGRTGDYYLYETDARGQHFKMVSDRSTYFRDLAIDPYARRLFFVEDPGKLSSLSLENSNISTYTEFGNLYMSDIKRIAVDTNEQFIYMIGKIVDDTDYHLVRIDYNDSSSKILLNGTSLSDVRGVDVYNGTLVWINYASSQYSVYRCKLTPKCKEYKVIYQSSEGIYDAKIYHPEKQTPGRKFLCESLKCSHGCYKTSLFVAKCSCPTGKHLGQDQTTCLDEPPLNNNLSAKQKLLKDSNASNKEQLQEKLTNLTTNNTNIEQTTYKSNTSTEEVKVAELLEHLHGLFNQINLNHTSNKQEGKTLHVHQQSRVTFSEVFLSIVSVLVLVFLATVIYILIRGYRSINKSGVIIRNTPTELRELTGGYLDSADCTGKSAFEIKLIK